MSDLRMKHSQGTSDSFESPSHPPRLRVWMRSLVIVALSALLAVTTFTFAPHRSALAYSGGCIALKASNPPTNPPGGFGDQLASWTYSGHIIYSCSNGFSGYYAMLN